VPSKIFRKTLLPSRLVLSRSLEKPFFHQDKFHQDPYESLSSKKIFRKALLPSRQVLSRSKGENPSSIKKEHEAL
jgi:hypothetical protein